MGFVDYESQKFFTLRELSTETARSIACENHEATFRIEIMTSKHLRCVESEVRVMDGSHIGAIH